jgi:6-phosphofructokinase 1
MWGRRAIGSVSGLVKLMGPRLRVHRQLRATGRHPGGICLIHEIAFSIEAVVQAATQLIKRDRYVVFVVAEGAGQDLLDRAAEWGASGNRRQDIGAF